MLIDTFAPAEPELILKGLPTAPGIAIGQAHIYRHTPPPIEPRRIKQEETEQEWEKYNTARNQTRWQLEELRARLTPQVGESVAGIFDAQLAMLDDVTLSADMERAIFQENMASEWALLTIVSRWREELLSLPDPRFHQRAQDLQDLCRRLLINLTNSPAELLLEAHSSLILVADDLLPSDVIILLSGGVLGVVTEQGGATSHTAILTRALQVPAVVGIREITRKVARGDQVVVNGNSGKVIVRPQPPTLVLYKEKWERYRTYMESLKDAVRLPAVTRDGRKIALRANIELPQEVHTAINQGGEGVGLYRSEYLLLARGTLPDEEEQERNYRYILREAYPHPVKIRTFDVGGDKLISGLTSEREPNPMVGWRAIRVQLDQPELLKSQLRAILKASPEGNVYLMIPFITDIDEVRAVKQYLHQVEEELNREGIPYQANIPLGIMIETPAAALMAQALAEEVSFFSIGTNDLTQFILAVDRGNPKVANRYQPFHPAVLRTMKRVIEAGHSKGLEVGVCGEMAANPTATKLLIGLGVDELSVSPLALPEIKKLVRSLSYEASKTLAEEVLTLTTAKEAHTLCWETMKHNFSDLPIWFD